MNYAIVVSVFRDDAVLQSTLLRSPAVKTAKSVMCQRGFATVSGAYNDAIRKSDSDILVFTHPDVYLPGAWYESFQRCLAWLSEEDPEWGVVGLMGCLKDGASRGFTYSTGLGGFIGKPFPQPIAVRTLDEFVFAIRRSSGLTFDENIPGAQSQLCTPDVCLQAEQRGMKSYALPCLAIHNSNRWSYLPLKFWRCYLYMRKKWKTELPVHVPYCTITAGCWPMLRNTIRGAIGFRNRSHRVVTRVDDPAALYARLRADINCLFSEAPDWNCTLSAGR